jgi:hypothetical protein
MAVTLPVSFAVITPLFPMIVSPDRRKYERGGGPTGAHLTGRRTRIAKKVRCRAASFAPIKLRHYQDLHAMAAAAQSQLELPKRAARSARVQAQDAIERGPMTLVFDGQLRQPARPFGVVEGQSLVEQRAQHGVVRGTALHGEQPA